MVATGTRDRTTAPTRTPSTTARPWCQRADRQIQPPHQHTAAHPAQPCIVCGRSPGHAHHLRFAQPSALRRKVSDEWTIPLCATYHKSLHSVGDEERWWKEKGIDATTHAVRIWWETRHPRPEWARDEAINIPSNRAFVARRE